MPERKVFVAGHRGLVGSALVRALERQGDVTLLLRTRQELDLGRQAAVEAFLTEHRPDVVVLAAAKVGGILANKEQPGDFIGENLRIQVNVIDGALRAGVKTLLFLGSSCIYPRLAPQPIVEDALLTGPLESTNEAYAVAKIAGLKMCEYYAKQYEFDAFSVMPTNLYGPGDNFDLTSSHVLPALIRKFHDAKVSGAVSVTLWGTGTPKREFLHVDDLAGACLHLLSMTAEARAAVSPQRMVNVGYGEDITILELAQIVRDVVGANCEIVFDRTKPDGTPRKIIDSSRIRALGWTPKISLREGIRSTYEWYRANVAR